jgi:hypothetical protein
MHQFAIRSISSKRLKVAALLLAMCMVAQLTVACARPAPTPAPLPTPTPVAATRSLPVATAQTQSPSIFFDDFEDGLDDAWSVVTPIVTPVPDQVRGDWITDRGRARVTGEIKEGKEACAMVYVGDKTWDRIAVDLDLFFPSGVPSQESTLAFWLAWDRARLAAAAQASAGESRWHMLAIVCHENSSQCGAWYSDVVESEVQLATMPSHLRLEIAGKRMRLFLNDALIYDYGITESHAGAIAIYGCAPNAEKGQASVWIDNFRVSSLHPQEAEGKQ